MRAFLEQYFVGVGVGEVVFEGVEVGVGVGVGEEVEQTPSVQVPPFGQGALYEAHIPVDPQKNSFILVVLSQKSVNSPGAHIPFV